MISIGKITVPGIFECRNRAEIIETGVWVWNIDLRQQFLSLRAAHTHTHIQILSVSVSLALYLFLSHEGNKICKVRLL